MSANRLVKQLDSALRRKSDGQFLHHIGVLDARWNGVPSKDCPEPLDLFGELSVLHQYVTSEGIWKYLADDEGAGFEHALLCSKRIGAKKTTAYLKAVAKLFPRQRVPLDKDKRYAVVEKLEEKAAAKRESDALRKLDVKYAEAMPEIAHTLRRWVREHRGAIDRMLAEIGPPPSVRKTRNTASDALLAKFERRTEKAIDENERKRSEFAEKARRIGILPLGTKREQDYDTFLAAVAKLGAADWTVIVQRAAARKDRFNTASREAMNYLTYIFFVEETDRAKALRAKERWKAARTRAIVRLDALSDEAIEGEQGTLRRSARSILQTATWVLYIHDWLALHPAKKGTFIAEHAFAPFAGFVATPRFAALPARRPH